MAKPPELTNFAAFYKNRTVGKFTAYKVQLAGLQEGRFEQEMKVDTTFFKNMENTDVISADVRVLLTIDHKHDAYKLSLKCEGQLQVPCDRCLDPVEIPVDTTFDVTVKYGPTYSDEADDVLVIPYEDTSLNVAYMIYDTLMLTIPLRHVHAPGKCNRAMTAMLRSHRHPGGGDADEEQLAEETLEEAESQGPDDDSQE